jgi:hypothetical protein
MNTTHLEWTRRPATVQAGEYAESTITITELVSTDGRFSIKRCGAVQRRRTNGVRGQLVRRWMWTGYRLTDSAVLPAWVSPTKRCSTVALCKAEAARRAKREN